MAVEGFATPAIGGRNGECHHEACAFGVHRPDGQAAGSLRNGRRKELQLPGADRGNLIEPVLRAEMVMDNDFWGVGLGSVG